MEKFFIKERVRFNKGTTPPKIGDKFGKFTVIDDRMYKTEKDNHNYVKVQCDCGYICIQPHSLLVNKTRMGCCECFLKFRAKNYKTIGVISSKYFSEIKRNAKLRNLEFSLTMTFLNELFQQQNSKCALSGIDLILFPVKHSESRSEITASLDRKDSQKGYTENNVQFVHKSINIMKGCLSDSEFINLCKYISNYNQDYHDNFEPSQLNGAMNRYLYKSSNRSKLEGATHRE